jgi:hypothetical protein
MYWISTSICVLLALIVREQATCGRQLSYLVIQGELASVELENRQRLEF